MKDIKGAQGGLRQKPEKPFNLDPWRKKNAKNEMGKMQSKRTDLQVWKKKKARSELRLPVLAWPKKWKKCSAHLLAHPPGEDIPTI